jgi:hypothetical protein
MKNKIDINIPDFFVVGAAKAGTTSLWYYLRQHKNVFMVDDVNHKELGYFSDLYGVNDFCQYVSYFKNAKNDQLIGEVCTSYLSSPESAKKIKEINPNAKIIISLRHPVKRAYSLYNWMVSQGYENINSFKLAVEKENDRINDPKFQEDKRYLAYCRNYYYIHSGLYYEQVKRYYDVFGEENCKVILFENLIKNPLYEIANIFRFLNLECDNLKLDLEPQNKSLKIRSTYLQYFLRNVYHRYTYRFFIPQRFANWLKRILHSLNQSNVKPSKINDDLYKELIHYFTEDIHHTSKLLKLDLTDYLK